MISFTPFPAIKTERLILRQLRISDEEELMKLWSDECVNTFINRPKTMSPEETRSKIIKLNGGVAGDGWIYWGIRPKDSDKLIGTICLWNIDKEKCRGEIGFELSPDYQRKGLMKEALKEVLDFGFSKIGLKIIDGVANKNNVNSIKLMEKFGFKRDLEAENDIVWEKYEIGKMEIYSLAVNS